MFISTIVFLFSGNAIAQTNIAINNTNLVRLGGDVTVAEKQVVENAMAITLIGIPLIPLVSLMVGLTSLVGSLGISLFIGQQVMRDDRQSKLQQFSIGLLIITMLSLIPFIGGLVVCAVSLLGLGSLLTWRFSKAQPPILE